MNPITLVDNYLRTCDGCHNRMQQKDHCLVLPFVDREGYPDKKFLCEECVKDVQRELRIYWEGS